VCVWIDVFQVQTKLFGSLRRSLKYIVYTDIPVYKEHDNVLKAQFARKLVSPDFNNCVIVGTHVKICFLVNFLLTILLNDLCIQSRLVEN